MQDAIIGSLDVFWENDKVGSYDKFASGSEQFAYAADYLSKEDAQPISHSLSLRTEPYSATQLRPYDVGPSSRAGGAGNETTQGWTASVRPCAPI